MKLVRLILFIFLLVSGAVSAQERMIPLQRFYSQEVERVVIKGDSDRYMHTGLKPLRLSRFDAERMATYARDTVKYYYPHTRLLFRDHLFEVKTEDFQVAVDPLFNLMYGEDWADTTGYEDSLRMFTNIRGVLLQGAIGKQVSFATGFYESQAFVPLYQKDYIDSTGVVPGMGRTKVFQGDGFDYGMSFGWLNYEVNEHIGLQVGYGKHFIGHGYRSLLLSDAAFNYPYARADLSFWDNRINYTAIGAGLQSLERMPLGEVPESLFKKKAASFHYLSITPLRNLELGFFEGIIWQRWDSTGIQALNYGAYIPVIGANTAIQGWGGKNNVVMGLNAKVTVLQRFQIYGQYLIDDPDLNQGGFQVGMRWMDAGLKNLDFQVEWNQLQPRTYANVSSLQSYSHFGQPLGHPSGPGMEEVVAMVDYRYRRLVINLKFNRIVQDGGKDGLWQVDPTPQNEILILLPNREVQQIDAEFGFTLNRQTNMRFLIGYTDRIDRIGGQNLRHTNFFYATIRTNLHNRYFDF